MSAEGTARRDARGRSPWMCYVHRWSARYARSPQASGASWQPSRTQELAEEAGLTPGCIEGREKRERRGRERGREGERERGREGERERGREDERKEERKKEKERGREE